jgi:D-aminopeptidase
MSQMDDLLLTRRVERLLAPFEGRPGMTIGVVQDGRMVVHRSAGLASVELGVPIGPGTCFRIASVSKQFTCAAILMLAAEGRLSLEDRVGDHLPAMTEPTASLSLRLLMHNASGVRDMFGILLHGGADLAQPCSPAALMAGIARQRTLNFAPGSRFLYSNSNFLLLGRIAEAASGEALAAFLERRIFAPLGMNRTRMVESTRIVVPGLATGYLLEEGGDFIRAAHALPLHGEGALISCVEDLALWAENAVSGRVGGAALTEALETTMAFTGGGTNLYARGLIVRDYRGVRTVGHGGLWPGFKTEFLRAPAHRTAVIVISNNGDSDPALVAHRVLDVMIDGQPDVHAVHLPPPEPVAGALVGRWLDPASGFTLDVAAVDGALVFRTFGLPFSPVVLQDGRIGTVRGSSMFALRVLTDDSVEVEQDAGERAVLHRVRPGAALPEHLAGRFGSAEMATEWTISPEGDAIQISGPLLASAGPWTLEAIEGDFFRIYSPNLLTRGWMDAQVIREEGRVTGLSVSGNRVKAVAYTRLDWALEDV